MDLKNIFEYLQMVDEAVNRLWAIPMIMQIQALAPVIILGCIFIILFCLLALLRLNKKNRLQRAINEELLKKQRAIDEALFKKQRAIDKEKLILSTLRREILDRKEKVSEFERKCKKLNALNFESMNPVLLLDMANSNELGNLREVLSMKQGGAQAIVTEIRSVGSHTFGTLYRRTSGKDPHVQYMEVVNDVLEQVGGSINKKRSYFEKECQIIEQYTSQMMAKMSDVEKQEFIDSLKQEAKKNGESFSGVIGAGGGILLANASGFGVYLLASTAVGSVTSILGITLPFAFYTSMSSTISLITGPVGWAVLAIWGVSKVGSPNKKKTLSTVIMVAAIRARMIVEKKKSVQLKVKNVPKLQEEIASIEARVEHIKLNIDELENSSWP